jgi:hypothetical protein
MMWKHLNELEKIEDQGIDSKMPDEETVERLKALGYVQ